MCLKGSGQAKLLVGQFSGKSWIVCENDFLNEVYRRVGFMRQLLGSHKTCRKAVNFW